eukprot:PhM_4_TR15620/c1_g1_i1/m.66302
MSSDAAYAVDLAILATVLFFISLYVLHYYVKNNWRTLRKWVLAVILLSIWICISPPAILLIDIDATTKGVSLPWMSSLWMSVFWITQVLSWVVLPLIQEYVASGEFTPKRKLLHSLKLNTRLYLVLGSISGTLIAYVSFVKGLTSVSQLEALVLAAANAFGLVLIILFLAYGMATIPKRLWRRGDVGSTLEFLYWQCPSLHDDLENARFEYVELRSEVHRVAVGLRMPYVHYMDRILHYFELVDSSVAAVSHTSNEGDKGAHRRSGGGGGKRSNSQKVNIVSNNSEEKTTNTNSANTENGTDRSTASSSRSTSFVRANMRSEASERLSGHYITIDESTATNCDAMYSQFVRLHAEAKAKVSRLVRLEDQWATLVGKCIRIEDSFRRYQDQHTRLLDIREHIALENLLDLAVDNIIVPVLYRLASAALFVLGSLIAWSEFALPFHTHVKGDRRFFELSLAYFVGSDSGTVNSFRCAIVLVFMATASYWSAFQFKLFNIYELTPHHSDPASLCFTAIFLTRLIMPLCYNFLFMAHLSSSATVTYSRVFGNMDVVDFLGEWFNRFLPIFILILYICLLTNVFGRILAMCGIESMFDDLDLEDDRIANGKKLVEAHTRRK